MPNLNVKTGKESRLSQYAPGVFTKNGQTITVTTYAAVESLLRNGWTRTSD